MRIPYENAAQALKFGLNAARDADAPVRVAVYLDATASRFLIDTVRAALVPETTAALVRVERLSAAPPPPKADTDVIIVLTCGSPVLEDGVRSLVISGAPVCVVAESSVEVPFITADTPMLGLVAATDPDHLTASLSRWILDRTEKGVSFAASFPFMREAMANRVIMSAAIANAATGALFFVPGANYPVMTFAQISMAFKLSAIYGYPFRLERAYEVAAVAAAGLVCRAASRQIGRSVPCLRLVIRALVAGVGTWGMGCALEAAYEHGIDYTGVNEAVRRVASATRDRAPMGEA